MSKTMKTELDQQNRDRSYPNTEVAQLTYKPSGCFIFPPDAFILELPYCVRFDRETLPSSRWEENQYGQFTPEPQRVFYLFVNRLLTLQNPDSSTAWKFGGKPDSVAVCEFDYLEIVLR